MSTRAVAVLKTSIVCSGTYVSVRRIRLVWFLWTAYIILFKMRPSRYSSYIFSHIKCFISSSRQKTGESNPRLMLFLKQQHLWNVLAHEQAGSRFISSLLMRTDIHVGFISNLIKYILSFKEQNNWTTPSFLMLSSLRKISKVWGKARKKRVPTGKDSDISW
jgi:hypothetical protein